MIVGFTNVFAQFAFIFESVLLSEAALLEFLQVPAKVLELYVGSVDEFLR